MQKNTDIMKVKIQKLGNKSENIILKGGNFFWDSKCGKDHCDCNSGECDTSDTKKFRFHFELRYFDEFNYKLSFFKIKPMISYYSEKVENLLLLQNDYPIIITKRFLKHCKAQKLSIPKAVMVLVDSDEVSFSDIYDKEKYFQIVSERLINNSK